MDSQTQSKPGMGDLIPMPVSATATGDTFTLAATTDIYVEPATAELMSIGGYLADKLRPSTGYELRVLPAAGVRTRGNLYLTTQGGDLALGEEGYHLTVTPDWVTLAAYRPAGFFRGVQTIRQLLPPSIERPSPQPGPWPMATGMIRDTPRFAWRGFMLDVSRHFFGVDDVKRLMDLMAFYKMNIFHLHLSDDQGWRIAINSWPNLAAHGGSTQVGGGEGGYYTQADYADLVAYGQAQYITVVPEIDMPGHTNAALASYPELNGDGVAPALYTGVEVGFSSLCAGKELTFTFVDDVVREVAALTPGPYFHIGGDEAHSTGPDDYARFVERAQTIVQAHGKQMVGWGEIARIKLLPTSIAHHWHSDMARVAARQGVKVIMSPASRTYLDMQYDAATPRGLHWAGYVGVEDAYKWDPAAEVDGLAESDILGVEAPLWSETLQTIGDVEFMGFPRLLGQAEIGWSPGTGRGWDEYRLRLGAHGPRLAALGAHFYPSPQIDWE